MEGGQVDQFFQSIQHFLHLHELAPRVRRVVVGVVGGSIVLVGVAMIILPGPAILVIPLGLAVLGTEFLWARRYVRKARRLITRAKKSVTG